MGEAQKGLCKGYRTMINLPKEGRRIYEAVIYNKVLRALVKGNESHDYFNDQWADSHVCDVSARNKGEARKIVSQHYPPEDGFVIQDLYPSAS